MRRHPVELPGGAETEVGGDPDDPAPTTRFATPGDVPAIDVLVSLSRPWTVVLSLVGDHDLTTVRAFVSQATSHLERCDRLVVDLTRTTFVDSAVASALVRLARDARPRGASLQVVATPGDQAHRVLHLMGLLAHLGWTDHLPEMHAARNGASAGSRGRRPAATSPDGPG